MPPLGLPPPVPDTPPPRAAVRTHRWAHEACLACPADTKPCASPVPAQDGGWQRDTRCLWTDQFSVRTPSPVQLSATSDATVSVNPPKPGGHSTVKSDDTRVWLSLPRAGNACPTCGPIPSSELRTQGVLQGRGGLRAARIGRARSGPRSATGQARGAGTAAPEGPE